MNHTPRDTPPISDHMHLFDEADERGSDYSTQFGDSEAVSALGGSHIPIQPNATELGGRMGQAFVNARKLTQDEVVRIIQLQRRKRIRFGEAAIKLGLLTEADVHEVLSQQFNYQTISKHKGGSRRKISGRLLISHSPYSSQAEAIRRFRAEIMLRAGDQECLIIAMVSPNAKEGKSHLSASLAIAFAQLNIKTLLIDANLRKPSQHHFFDLANKTGLSTMLAGRTLPTLDLSHSVTDFLSVITAGPRPPNPSEILSSPGLTDLLDKFKHEVKVIVIDTPPTLIGPDAQIIAPQAGSSIMVCRKDQTSTEDMRKAFRDIESTSTRILGTFFNTVPQGVDTIAGPLSMWLGRLGWRTQSKA